MKCLEKTSRYAGLGLILTAALLADGCGTISAPASRPVAHIVLMWLKHPERAADRAQLIRASHSLHMIPGVVKVEAGRTLPASAPLLSPEVERSFDLAVVVTFRDRVALDRYKNDPRHLAAERNYLQPLVRRYEVYNLDVR